MQHEPIQTQQLMAFGLRHVPLAMSRASRSCFGWGQKPFRKSKLEHDLARFSFIVGRFDWMEGEAPLSFDWIGSPSE